MASVTNDAITSFTDNTTGTASDTLATVPFNATWSQAQADVIDNNVASLAAKIEEVLDVLRENYFIRRS